MKLLLDYLQKYYTPDMYPALESCMRQWRTSRPFAGKKVLDATPVFRNTMVKYAVLLAGGADLTVSVGRDIPCDRETADILPRFGIRVADDEILQEDFDVVADCAGRHCRVSSRYGYAELTRSGLEYYRECRQAVFSVDSGIVKQFETAFGTGESFFRAMRQLGYRDFSGKTVLIFGGGKVGRGVAFYALREGMNTIVADRRKVTVAPGAVVVDPADKVLMKKLIAGAWCIVSATGVIDALAEFAGEMQKSDAVIANMGVEDEFGSVMPRERVLNDKHPLNFILDEPTEIRYIDPSMALSNLALAGLLAGKFPSGINTPPRDMEMAVIADMRNGGMLDKEIDIVLKENSL